MKKQEHGGLSREEKRRSLITAAVIVLFAAVIAVLAVFYPELTGSTEVHDLAVDETLSAASEGLDSIAVTCALDPETDTLSGTQVLTLTNRTGQDQEAVVLRSWTGAYLKEDTAPGATDEWYDSTYPDGFDAGGLHMLTAAVAEREGTAVYRFNDTACTVLEITVPDGWAAGETITLTLTWKVDIPACASAFGVSDGIYALGHVFPVPALWEDGAWRTDEYASIGDSAYSACVNWTVDLTVPSGYVVGATGYTAAQTANGQSLWHMTMPAARDFAMAVSKSYQTSVTYVGDTLIVARAKTRDSAKKLVKYAKSALQVYEARWGEYVYPVLTLAETVLPQGAAAFPCCVMISSAQLAEGGDTLKQTVAHEVAHQWWSVLVGSDPVNQAWQDESLCEYAMLVWLGDTAGADDRADAEFSRIESALRITIPRGVTPGSPISYFGDTTEYTWVVYRRGASFWLAMEKLLGQDALDTALRSYAERYRFGIAMREDLTDILSGAAGMDISALMSDYLDTNIDN